MQKRIKQYSQMYMHVLELKFPDHSQYYMNKVVSFFSMLHTLKGLISQRITCM